MRSYSNHVIHLSHVNMLAFIEGYKTYLTLYPFTRMVPNLTIHDFLKVKNYTKSIKVCP